LFSKTVWAALQHYRASRSAASSWPLTFLVLFLCINLTESHILIQNDVMWVLFVSTVLALWKWKQSLMYVRKTQAWNARSPEFGAVPS
jgi:hypothetical protein